MVGTGNHDRNHPCEQRVHIFRSEQPESNHNNVRRICRCFGFTEKEVFEALEERGLGSEKQKVKEWYDGFIFGEHRDIYNPWSILNFLDKGKFDIYWANTSSNSLVGKLIREGNRSIKEKFERLLEDETIRTTLDRTDCIRSAQWQ